MTKVFNHGLAVGVAALGLAAGAAQADQVIADDLILQGSLCVGLDCVNGESFGADTIRLKENNLRIHFQDTSNSASFPTTDWRIFVNDSSNGGASKFAIQDADAGRTPFTIEASAPSDSLYVDDGGRVGFGTGTPVVELHAVDGDTPTLRLQQDGSSGFGAQTWDLAGNETNFFIRDASNGSTLPFRIQPSAPSNAIYINEDGDIGMGTASPDFDLEISRAGDVIIQLANTSAGGVPWQFKNQFGNFRVTTPPGGGDDVELELDVDGNLALSGYLSIRDGVAAPAAAVNPDQAAIYVDTADGDLKVKFSNGTVRVLASD